MLKHLHKTNIMYKIFSLCCLFIISCSVHALSKNVRFRHINMNHGLSYNSILCLMEDHRGIIWIGSRDGLNKYNSVKNIVFKHNINDTTSLTNSHINCIYETKDNQLWIGTARGLNSFDRIRNSFNRFGVTNDSTGLCNGYVWCIQEYNEDILLIGTAYGLNVYDRRKGKFDHCFVKKTLSNSNSITTIRIDNYKNIWIGTKEGLYLFDINSRQFTPIYFSDQTNSIEIRDLKQDKTGNFWLATETKGVYQFKYENYEIKKLKSFNLASGLPSNTVRKLFVDDQFILAGTLKGLCIINLLTGNIENIVSDDENPDGISDSSVHDIIKDSSGGYWLATYTDGVNYYHDQLNLFEHIKRIPGKHNTLSNSVVHGFYEVDENHVYIATGDGGLNYWNGDNNQYTIFSNKNGGNISSDVIKSMDVDNHNNLWLATLNGLNHFNTKTKQFKVFLHQTDNVNSINSNQIRVVLVDKKNRVWIGYNEAYFQLFNLQENHFKSFPEVGKIVEALYEDSQNRLWIGERNGLKCMDLNKLELLNIDNMIKDYTSKLKYINAINEDDEGNIWIGTQGYGLIIFMRDKIMDFDSTNGLCDNTINAIITDDEGNNWISTNKGISKVILNKTREGKLLLKSENYNVDHGLQGAQFEPGSVYKSQHGRLYFGGVNGFNVFNPSTIKTTTVFPEIVIDELYLNFNKIETDELKLFTSKPLYNTDTLYLKYYHRNLSLHFTGINYINPQSTYYRYKMTGLDDRWIDLDVQSSINLTYLPIGNHELIIQASTNKNMWGTDYKKIVLSIAPPWWKTWWAYVLYFLLISCMVWLVVKYSKLWMEIKAKLNIEKYKREKDMELYESKLSFYTDVSHELRTPLTLILAPLEKIISNTEINEKLKKQLMLIKRSGNRMMQLLDQVLSLRKLETGHERLQVSYYNIVDFMNEISLTFSDLASSQNIQYEFSPHVEELRMWFDKEKMEIILYNLLFNAFKHTPHGGSVNMSLDLTGKISEHWEDDFDNDRENKCVKIIIANNGEGISEENMNHIFDFFYSGKNKNDLNLKGYGLGLELTKRMVDLHKGDIKVDCNWASNGEDRWTTFTVLFPLADDLFDAADKLIEKTSAEKPIEIDSIIEKQANQQYKEEKKDKQENKSILVIEDDREVRTFIRDLFIDSYLVYEAENGDKGLDLTIQKIPDIVICDVMMPGLNGFEYCKRLKTDARICHIPVVLLTARSTLDDKMEGIETGADEYITKPFSSDYLVLRVQNLVKQRETMRDYYHRMSILEPEDVIVVSMDEKLLKKAMDYINKHIDDSQLSVERLSIELGLSRMHLYRKIKALTNLSVSEFIRSVKLKRAASLLQNSKLSIKEVQNMVGFDNPDHFRNCFKAQYGLTPSDYQRKKWFNKD